MAAQRGNYQLGQHPAGTNMAPASRNGMQAGGHGAGPNNLHATGQAPASLAGPPRPPQMPRPSAGVQSTTSFATSQQGMPHAPMQPTAQMPGSTRVPPQIGSDSVRIYQEATRVQAEQQRFLQQRQQQQQHPHANGQISPNMSGANLVPPGGPSTHLSFRGGSGSPSMNGTATNTSSSSPRMSNPSHPQALSSGVMPTIHHIMNSLRAVHPNATQEQISQLATNQLKQQHQQGMLTTNHVHAAMQAAAGGNSANHARVSNGMGNVHAPAQQQTPTAIMNGNSLLGTQQYAHALGNHQRHQQSRSSGTPFNGQRPPSRGGTPQIHRTPSGQAHPSPSPVPSQVQLAGQ